VKFPEAIREIYRRFGILNLFNPHRPNGSYRLDLSIYEEKLVCRILMDLAKVEGYAQMTNVNLDGKPIETVNKELADKIGLEATPTLILADKDGARLLQIGNKEELKKLLSEVVNAS
jgi:hypothetical protein